MDYFNGFLVAECNASYLDDVIRGFYTNLNISLKTNTRTLLEFLSLVEGRLFSQGASFGDLVGLELDFKPLAGIADLEFYPVFRFVRTDIGFILSRLFSEENGFSSTLLSYNCVPRSAQDYISCLII